MAILSVTEGSPTKMWRSILPGRSRAGSIRSGRDDATTKNTDPLFVSRPLLRSCKLLSASSASLNSSKKIGQYQIEVFYFEDVTEPL